MNRNDSIEDALTDIRASVPLSNYEAVDVLWVALIRMANTMPGSNEHKRMMNLVKAISEDRLRTCLLSPGVTQLLDLDPPLETVLSEPHGRVDPEASATAIQRIRERRDADPREAVLSLGEVLKRIRNKRAHGFKTRSGPRDREILGAARATLDDLCRASVEALANG
jgi:hypothetical protein